MLLFQFQFQFMFQMECCRLSFCFRGPFSDAEKTKCPASTNQEIVYQSHSPGTWSQLMKLKPAPKALLRGPISFKVWHTLVCIKGTQGQLSRLDTPPADTTTGGMRVSHMTQGR